MHTYKLKSMAELLADGWYIEVRSDGGKQLARTGATPLDEKHWTRLGGAIGLNRDLDGKRGLFCVERVKWSRYLIEAPLSRGTGRAAVAGCTCDIKALMDRGCQCGGFRREQQARQA